MRPGTYDVDERVQDMDHNGILASMCFPSFVGFNGGIFRRAATRTCPVHDPGLQRLAHRRVVSGLSRSVHTASDQSVMGTGRDGGEMRRVSAKGCTAMTIPEFPHLEGLPSYHDLEYWGPFFDARPRSSW